MCQSDIPRQIDCPHPPAFPPLPSSLACHGGVGAAHPRAWRRHSVASAAAFISCLRYFYPPPPENAALVFVRRVEEFCRGGEGGCRIPWSTLSSRWRRTQSEWKWKDHRWQKYAPPAELSIALLFSWAWCRQQKMWGAPLWLIVSPSFLHRFPPFLPLSHDGWDKSRKCLHVFTGSLLKVCLGKSRGTTVAEKVKEYDRRHTV